MRATVRRPSAERREQIARAVLRLIAERGLTSLTTTSLAEEVGLTSGALFRHFASLEEILREAARYATERIEATFPDPGLPPLRRLLALARNRVRVLESDPGLAWLLRSDQVYLTLPRDAVDGLRGLVRRTVRYLTDALREGAAAGTIRADIDPEILVVPVTGTIHAVIGMSGLRRHAGGARGASPERVLSALARLLAPPGGRKPEARRDAGRRRGRRGRPTTIHGRKKEERR